MLKNTKNKGGRKRRKTTKAAVISDGGLRTICVSCSSYSLLMCRQRLDFRFAALFLWMMLVLASLSSIF